MENFSVKAIPFLSEGKDSIRIHLEGDLTIKNAKSIKKELEAKLGNNECLELNLEKVTALDITIIQLICSLKKLIHKRDLKMDLHLNIDQEIENIITYSGMIQLLNPEKFRESIKARI